MSVFCFLAHQFQRQVVLFEMPLELLTLGYRGEIMLKFGCSSNLGCYKVGDRVGQLIIMPYPQVQFEEVEELSDSDRGEGGFGSTGV